MQLKEECVSAIKKTSAKLRNASKKTKGERKKKLPVYVPHRNERRVHGVRQSKTKAPGKRAKADIFFEI